MGRMIDADEIIHKLERQKRENIGFLRATIESSAYIKGINDAIMIIDNSAKNSDCVIGNPDDITKAVDGAICELEEFRDFAFNRYVDTPYNSPFYDRYYTQYTERQRCLDIATRLLRK